MIAEIKSYPLLPRTFKFYADSIPPACPRPPNVLSLSCTAGPACRSRCGAAAAATDEQLGRTNCRRRDAVTLAPCEVEWVAGRSRAVPASAS